MPDFDPHAQLSPEPCPIVPEQEQPLAASLSCTAEASGALYALNRTVVTIGSF
jgi:hypothetical protein